MSQDNRTRSQIYAEKSLARINAVKDNKKLKDEYKSRADSSPVMVMQAGLVQAIGFMQAKRKDKPAYGQYVDDLASILGEKNGVEFHQKIIDAPIADYRRLTRETLAAAGWLKRFGQAYLSDK